MIYNSRTKFKDVQLYKLFVEGVFDPEPHGAMWHRLRYMEGMKFIHELLAYDRMTGNIQQAPELGEIFGEWKHRGSDQEEAQRLERKINRMFTKFRGTCDTGVDRMRVMKNVFFHNRMVTGMWERLILRDVLDMIIFDARTPEA